MTSRFAVLKIEDDSDEEMRPWTAANNNKKGAQGKGKQPGKPTQKSGSLIVHAVERQRPKVKKNNKEKMVDPATGYVVQDGSAEEDLKKEKVRQALAASASPQDSKSQSEEPQNGVQNGVAAANPGQDLDVEIRRLNLQSADQNELSRFYKNRLLEAMKELNEAKEEAAQANSRVDYYKDRYRKLVELFRDAECLERANLIKELENSNTMVSDLTVQLNQVTKSLEQTRSRLSAYESKR